jgi:UDPglucose 6-dehydrogenase
LGCNRTDKGKHKQGDVGGIEMTTVGFVGLGKLGVPVAVAMTTQGIDVLGYDIDDNALIKGQTYHEKGIAGVEYTALCKDALLSTRLKQVSLETLAENSDIVFVAVQTPHDRAYEGITRLPLEREGFDYKYLRIAVHDVSGELVAQHRRDVPIVVVSTVLPGTTRGNGHTRLSPTRIRFNRKGR